ncbi:Hypothetical predicted protein [Mytilus galloprovincialis]|uniref:Uncharacterized protein n=1 Tax=Mytilus galloprovincialis TaxID=29158 RepID=A0A8B6EFM4_MYTGA|nr:Hypothetical predicted protein [Mytilus galloprovincialis]
MNGAAKVRVWLSTDFPLAVVNMTVGINTLFNFKEIYHGLGSYPDILYVQIMLSDGNISDAQGSRIAVFGASDGWGLFTEDTEGTARILAWKTNKQGRIFHKGFTVSKSSKEESVLRFPRYYDLSNYLISVQVKVPDGDNRNMIFQSVGSSVATGIFHFSGIVYVYTTTEILFWKPISYNGHMFFIGDVFGPGHHSQICDTVDLHVEIYHLQSKGHTKNMEHDPCEDDSERHLHDMHRRFKNYKTMFQKRQEEMVCDKYLIPQHGAWFMSYNDMPTEPPTFLDCGTTHPIWLNGTIPTTSEGVVDRTACKVGFMSYCDEEIPVKIKRCEKYTAYFLLPTKHCPEAYCFGTKKEPPLRKPVIKASTYNKNGSSVDRLQFECYLNISTLNYAYYEVTWRWADSILSFKNESSQFSNLRLTDEHFKTLGVYVTCTVTALHFKHDTVGSNVTSDNFYAGLMVCN